MLRQKAGRCKAKYETEGVDAVAEDRKVRGKRPEAEHETEGVDAVAQGRKCETRSVRSRLFIDAVAKR
jgi:hypothetical protein